LSQGAGGKKKACGVFEEGLGGYRREGGSWGKAIAPEREATENQRESETQREPSRKLAVEENQPWVE